MIEDILMNFNDWITFTGLQIELILPNVFIIENEGSFLLLEDKKILFDEKLKWQLTEEEQTLVKEIDYLCFEFGGLWYYSDKNKFQLNPFRYLGTIKKEIDLDFAFLGIHGNHELLNGSRLYEDWVKKAKFLQIKTLGICELNTLAGTLPFQIACQQEKIKSIIGCTITIKEGISEEKYKVYVVSEIGWRNLLLINKEINVINDGFIFVEDLYKYSEGLILVLSSHYELNKKKVESLKKHFYKIYYQIDTVEFDNDEKDKQYLLNTKKYLDVYSNEIEPILINDAYYLDKMDAESKTYLNKISNIFDYKSKQQYFKSLDENFNQLKNIFKNEDKFYSLFEICINSLIEVESLCEFTIETGKLYLPKFDMKIIFKEYPTIENKNELIWFLIEKGFEERLSHIKDLSVYYERIAYEVEVIEEGQFIDYFLILWDVVRWCKTKDIFTGIGRGSGGGSLLAYTLHLTNIDPIKYDLLFERFMNRGRLAGNLPDLDTDFESLRKEEVKDYIKQIYGDEFVCSVGTYTTLQLKAGLKDLGRAKGLPLGTLDYISKNIQNFVEDEYFVFEDLFINATKNKQIKDFIKNNVELVNNIQLCLDQPRSKSIHPCATVIFPKEYNKNIYEWIPVRKEEGKLVSEWEGKYLEKIGLLKEDILGIKELDKFRFIVNLIKQTTGKDIDIYNLPVDDKGVYKLFQKGYNSSVFHLGSRGLTQYCQQLKPENIKELIAALALYRPAVIHIGAHEEFVKRKFKKAEIVYDYGLEEVTKSTYGILVYQEQLIKAVQVLGGFSLIEADDVRRATGKKIKKLIDSYRERFIVGAINNGCDKDEAEKIWNKLEQFSSYAFNASHSTAYAITGYIGQWLKYHYPLQFWTTAFEFALEDDISRYIAEIKKINKEIKIQTPDINKSQKGLYTDFKTRTIYWGFLKVKYCSEIATTVILEERNKNGEFYSLEEFCKRVSKTKVNKRVVESLILSGCFDGVCNITNVTERRGVLNRFYKIRGVINKDILFDYSIEEYEWHLLQKDICGLGEIDYSLLGFNLKNFKKLTYIKIEDFDVDREIDGFIGGVVKEVKERKSKNGKFVEITLQSNYDEIICTIWSDIYGDNKDAIDNSVGKILLISGYVKWNDFKKCIIFQTDNTSKIKII